MRGRGSCVSISDSNGDLLFYAFTRAGILGDNTQIISTNDSLMLNGGNIVGQGWYRELVIVTDPSDTNKYYLFSIGVTNSGSEGLFYSRIDMNQNNGFGTVVQKNVQLLPYQMQDGIQAIKHGNGRDWWIICHRWDIATNEFHKFLVTPIGVQGPFVQAIGDTSYGGFLNLTFSKSGNKVAIVDYHGLFELFNFDRCTGNFSLDPFYTYSVTSMDHYDFSHSAFSPNENTLYISTNEVVSYLFQLNLLDSNPVATKDTLWIQSSIQYAGGLIKLAPDNKIYYACNWYDGFHFPYPYPDSAHYLENENLGVVNDPNQLGTACDFQPYSFYLGGKRTYWGLPNNPDYMLGPDTNSICDTVLAIESLIEYPSGNLNVFYHSGWQQLFINASGLKGKNCSLRIYDLTGREIFREEGTLFSSYYTRDLSCAGFANGMYIVNLQTEKEMLSSRFIIH